MVAAFRLVYDRAKHDQTRNDAAIEQEQT